METTHADPHMARRFALMTSRDAAVKRRDWAAMDAITRRLAKLPTPTVKRTAMAFVKE